MDPRDATPGWPDAPPPPPSSPAAPAPLPPMPTPGPWDPTPGQIPAGWAPPTAPRRRSRKPWVVGCGCLLVLLIVGVGACTAIFARTFAAAGSVIGASHGQITSFNAQSTNGRMHYVFGAAAGIDASIGPRIACDVIVPALKGSDGAYSDWVLVDSAGSTIASSETPCP